MTTQHIQIVPDIEFSTYHDSKRQSKHLNLLKNDAISFVKTLLATEYDNHHIKLILKFKINGDDWDNLWSLAHEFGYHNATIAALQDDRLEAVTFAIEYPELTVTWEADVAELIFVERTQDRSNTVSRQQLVSELIAALKEFDGWVQSIEAVIESNPLVDQQLMILKKMIVADDPMENLNIYREGLSNQQQKLINLWFEIHHVKTDIQVGLKPSRS